MTEATRPELSDPEVTDPDAGLDPDDDLETRSPDFDEVPAAEPGEDLAAGPPGGI